MLPWLRFMRLQGGEVPPLGGGLLTELGFLVGLMLSRTPMAAMGPRFDPVLPYSRDTTPEVSNTGAAHGYAGHCEAQSTSKIDR